MLIKIINHSIVQKFCLSLRSIQRTFQGPGIYRWLYDQTIHCVTHHRVTLQRRIAAISPPTSFALWGWFTSKSDDKSEDSDVSEEESVDVTADPFPDKEVRRLVTR